MPRGDVVAGLVCISVEAEADDIRLKEKQDEIEKARREAEAAKRRARQLGHS